MKVLIEPNRFVELLEKSLIYPKLSNVVLFFSEKGVRVNDATLGGLGVVCVFKPEYFMEYPESMEPEEVVVSQTLLTLLKDSKSFDDEKVSVFTTVDEESGEKKIIIEGKSDRIAEKMEDITTERVPWEIMAAKDKGIILKGKDPLLCVRIKKEQFSLPKIGETKKYNLITEVEKILVKIKDESTEMERKIKPTKVDKITDGLDVIIDGTFFDTMVKLLPDELWLSLYGKSGLALTSKTENYAASYFLTASD